MISKKKVTGLAVAGALAATLLASSAYAAGFFTNGVPAAGGTLYPSTLPLTGNETIPVDTNLASGLNPQSESITPGNLAVFAPTPSVLTSAADLAVNAQLSNVFTISLSANATLDNPTNLGAGRIFRVVVTNAQTGVTLTYGSLYKWSGGTAPTFSITKGSVDLFTFVYDGTRIIGQAVQNIK